MRVGVSGARGIVGDGMGPGEVAALCESFGAVAAGASCALGMDTRESGPMLTRAASAALMASGLDVLHLGVAPTPLIFYESRSAGAGVAVTASHNGPEWNGLKFALRGRGIDASSLGRTGRAGKSHGRVGTEDDLEASYATAAIGLLGRVAAGTSVALDAGGGAAAAPARSILEGVGCTVIDVVSGGGPDPTSARLDALAEASQKCDVGVALDLDGDRAVIARNGTICPPDATLAAGVAWSLARGMRNFAISEDTSGAVGAMVRDAGGSVYPTMVGEANVVDVIESTPCDAGGEGSSAGLIIPEFNTCRDGMIAGAIVASMSADGTLDAAIAGVSGLHRIRQKVSARAPEHARIVEAVREEMRGEFSETGGLGGFRGTDDESTWLLVRGSNTEDAVRVSVESDNAERARRIAHAASEAVERHAQGS